MKLEKQITIQPPPHSDASGKVIYPPELKFDELNLLITDNTINKIITIQILNIPYPIILWRDQEYDELGDWTRSQVENKLKEKLGDSPEVFLRSLYPKTLEEHPNHPGTILSKMIKSLGIVMTDTCSCRAHALQMNAQGNDWCEQNIDTVVGWLREEAKRRGLPFIDTIGKLMVNRAIKKSRKLLANEPVPENDEELDNL